MNSKKAISKLLILSMVSMSMISIKSVNAESNWKDSEFFRYYSGQNIVETKPRQKIDYYSAYINNSGSDCGVKVDVWGYKGEYQYYRADCEPRFSYSKTQKCNYNGTIHVKRGQAIKLLNTVRENNLSFCSLKMIGDWPRVNLSGLWSPDSI